MPAKISLRLDNPCNTFSFFIADAPRFEAEPADLAVSLGQNAVFECRLQLAAGLRGQQSDWYHITWLKDDQPLIADHRMKIMASGLLEISDVRLSDRGNYRCNVTSVDESRLSRSASLKIIFDGGM